MDVSKPDSESSVSLKTCNNIASSIIPKLTPLSSYFKIQVSLKGWNNSTTVAAMVDSGATALFINERFVKANNFCTYPLICQPSALQYWWVKEQGW